MGRVSVSRKTKSVIGRDFPVPQGNGLEELTVAPDPRSETGDAGRVVSH
jgi:hypothetical protein